MIRQFAPGLYPLAFKLCAVLACSFTLISCGGEGAGAYVDPARAVQEAQATAAAQEASLADSKAKSAFSATGLSR